MPEPTTATRIGRSPLIILDTGSVVERCSGPSAEILESKKFFEAWDKQSKALKAPKQGSINALQPPSLAQAQYE
jgi:hypothetical protein